MSTPLLPFLRRHNIPFQIHRHPPLFSVHDSQNLRGNIPGAHTKNLFLRDKNHTLWLVTAEEHQPIPLKTLKTILNARKALSFAQNLEAVLGVKPGAVTPFALINDTQKHVQPVLDASILTQTHVNAHPLRNDATLTILTSDLCRFYELLDRKPTVVNFQTGEITQ